jgi:hypothetical protein
MAVPASVAERHRPIQVVRHAVTLGSRRRHAASEPRRIMRRTIEAFEFEHDGRTYICSPEARAGGKKEMWWWFRVSGDAQRYAPFEVVPTESRDAVAKRIVAWHAAMLERRSAPAVSPQAWWQRRKQASGE